MSNESEYPGLVPTDDEGAGNNGRIKDRMKDYVEKLRSEVAAEEAPTFNLVVKDGERGVDLRELHRELGSKQEFANWSKTKLRHFTQSVDYQPADEIVDRPQGGSYKKKGFVVSIECAKHIAMMEQTGRGRQVRQYFIDFEKAVREREATAPALSLPQTYPEALRALADAAEQNEQQAQQLQLQTRELAAKDDQLEVQQPKVEAFDDLMGADGLYGINAAAKLLNISLDGKKTIGEIGLYALLRKDKILGSDTDCWNSPMQGYKDRYFRVVAGTRLGREDPATGLRVSVATWTTKVTPEGLAWLKKRYAQLRLSR